MSNMYKRIKNDPRLTKKKESKVAGFFARLKGLLKHRGRNPWKISLSKKRTPLTQLLAPILIITIPVCVIMATDNTLMRLPDLYKYHLLSSKILSERMITADEDKVAQLISDYMVHKTNKFQMKEDLDYMPDDLFTIADGQMMHQIRDLVDIELMLGLFSLVVTIAIITYLVRRREKDLLLKSFYLCLPVFVIMQIADVFVLLFRPIRNRVFSIPTSDDAVNLLPALLNYSYFKLLTLAEVALSILLLGLIYYLVLNLSGRKSMFRR